MNEQLATRSAKLRHLIEHAPAGGIFHGTRVSGEKTLHEGFANEQRYFYLHDPNGDIYLVSIEQAR